MTKRLLGNLVIALFLVLAVVVVAYLLLLIDAVAVIRFV